MAKKSLKINQFHGGLNNYRDSRDTPDNALVNASNIMVDIPGKIRMMGRDMPFEQLANTVDIAGGVTPGYGLFAFKADHNLSGAATNDGNVFVVYQNGTKFNLAQNGVIYDPDTPVDGITAGFTPGWSGALNTVFHYTNERLFISDGNFDNTSNMPYVYEFLDNTLFPTDADHDIKWPAGWYGSSVSYPSMLLAKFQAENHATPQPPDTTSALNFNISALNNTTDTGSYQGDSGTSHYYWFGISNIYYHDEESPILHDPAGSTKYHTFNAAGVGENGELSLGLQISLDGSYDAATGLIPDSTLDKRIIGFKIYLMADGASTSNPTYYKDPLLVATADMNKETIISHEGNSQSFLQISGGTEADPTIYGNATALVISSWPTTTFEMENLYPHDIPTVRAKWKTSTVMGNQLFVGNVRRYKDDSVSAANEIPEPDKILRVIPPPLSKRAGIFPSTDFLEVASGDGDEIIKLESFADRLIVLKRSTTYVINISGDIEYIENEFKFAGIAAPYNSIATEFGIVWVNPKGAYLYDGEKLTNLIEGKIDPFISPQLSTGINDLTGEPLSQQMPGWSNFIGNSGGQLGYLPEEKHLLIFDTPYGNSENVTDENIQGNMMVLDLKSGSWTYSTDRISNYSRSNIISGVNKSCLFLGNVSSSGNTITTTILKEGRPHSNFYQEIHGITNDQISPVDTNYQLLLKDNQGVLTDLTGNFTWNVEEQATAFGQQSDTSQSFANKIATQIMLYNDEYSTNSILAEDISLDSQGFAYKIKVTFTAPDTTGVNGIPPFIFNKEIVWNTAAGYAAPSSSAAGIQFFNSGLGCGIAPIRSWYQEEAMTGHSNYTGNIILNEPGELLTELKNTWGGLQNYPYKEVDNTDPSEGPAYYASFPAFAPRNYIYKWLVNKSALYLGLPQQEFYEDEQATFGIPPFYAGGSSDLDEAGLLKGLPWGTTLPFGYHSNNDPWSSTFHAETELNARNSLTSPLYSYTGFTINPLGGRNLNYSDTEDHGSYTSSSDDGQFNIACAARTNPRLVRYMCNFTHNDSLRDYSSESPNMSNGPGYVLPNDINSGAYVSPGLIFTQSWSTDSEELHEKFVSDGGSNSGGEAQKNGNGFYRDNSGSQKDTQWPNGYFYFGFGKDNPNSKIVEGVGKNSDNTRDISKLEVLSYVPASNSAHANRSDSNLYAKNYFIGWQTRFNDFSESLEDTESTAEYFISKDLLDSGSNYLFKDFGDLMYTPGSKYSQSNNFEDDITPFNNVGNGFSYNSSKGSYGFSNSFPDADEIFTNFEEEDKETRVYGNGIPFNQQSPLDALSCEARDNMITRDCTLFKEPENIGTNGIVFETKIPAQYTNSPTSTRPKAVSINLNAGLQSIAIMNGNDSKAWEDSQLFYSDAGAGEQVAASGKLPSAVSYSSVPYLVIEVTYTEIILHYICDYDLNKQAHVIGNKYEWSLPPAVNSSLHYEFSDMVLTGGEVINVQSNKITDVSNPWLENDISDDKYEGQTYEPIHDYEWGINGYCKLRFAKSSQTSTSTKQLIELLAAGPGTVAFWNNPLKDENHSSHPDGLDTLSTFYPPQVKDTSFDSGIVSRELTDISGEVSGSVGSSGSGATAGFQLFSLGDNGEKREIILHNSRDLDSDQPDPFQANMLITKTGNAHSPISRSASDIKWTSGDYDDSMDVNEQLIHNLGTADIFSESPTFVTIYGSSSSSYPRITDNSSAAGGTEIILKAEDFNVNAAESYTISLQKYIAAGDIIYLSSSSKRYRVLTITYDGNNSSSNYGTTTITIDATINGSSGDHGVLIAVDANDIVSTASLTCGAVHFKDGGQTTVSSDLFISGGYTGALKVLQFNNSSMFADLVDSDDDYGTGGSAFIETKDFDFGNPSSIKNINYIDISAKGTGSFNFFYALDNSGNFTREDIDQLTTSTPFDDNLNFKTFRFKKANGSIKNCRSIQLRIQILSGEGFEMNDISIVYREKIL